MHLPKQKRKREKSLRKSETEKQHDFAYIQPIIYQILEGKRHNLNCELGEKGSKNSAKNLFIRFFEQCSIKLLYIQCHIVYVHCTYLEAVFQRPGPEREPSCWHPPHPHTHRHTRTHTRDLRQLPCHPKIAKYLMFIYSCSQTYSYSYSGPPPATLPS